MEKASTRYRILSLSIIIGSILLVLAAALFVTSRFNTVPSLLYAAGQSGENKSAFPADIDQAQLTDTQQKLIALLKVEYETQPDGTKYAQGAVEPWCADFVSWIMKEAGEPLVNPHTGGWRIPGTYTLREYYQREGRFEPVTAVYQPQMGDIVLYDNPSPRGQHTNFVLKNEDGILTTIGGNEAGKIRIQTINPDDDPGLLGYGRLR